jgi:hypothetical protein
MWSFGFDNHPLFVRVRAVFVPCLFPVILYSFLLPHKNMKTNVALLSSVRFRFVFIPTQQLTKLKSAGVIAKKYGK